MIGASCNKDKRADGPPFRQVLLPRSTFQSAIRGTYRGAQQNRRTLGNTGSEEGPVSCFSRSRAQDMFIEPPGL